MATSRHLVGDRPPHAAVLVGQPLAQASHSTGSSRAQERQTLHEHHADGGDWFGDQAIRNSRSRRIGSVFSNAWSPTDLPPGSGRRPGQRTLAWRGAPRAAERSRTAALPPPERFTAHDFYALRPPVRPSWGLSLWSVSQGSTHFCRSDPTVRWVGRPRGGDLVAPESNQAATSTWVPWLADDRWPPGNRGAGDSPLRRHSLAGIQIMWNFSSNSTSSQVGI